MLDKKALYAISAGVYVFTTLDDGRPVGRVVDAVSQVSSEPKRMSVALMKTGCTSQAIAKAGTGGRFAMTVLAEDAHATLIEAFGYQSSETVDKFAGFTTLRDESGVPYIPDGAVAELSCEVIDILDMGSHLLVIGEVAETQVFSDADPMTYAGYRKLKAAAKKAAAAITPAPAPAPSPEPEAPAKAPRYGWRCTICGYVVEQDELPDDFACPMCGVGKDLFERVEL